MKPIEFKECNTVYGKGQENIYKTLPACLFKDGEVVTCWKLSFKDVLRLLFTRRLWLCVATFNKPLQPLFMSTDKYEIFAKK